ncbi:hexuronate transporter [Rhodovastum atsumiense]|uniref:MFS transporter n=1 Tax=Rhodovastum atsumiense TaxID=504468 RepID=A0A5M6ITC0_9PROT|nr:MFS transporter [Rhodovastum atsumiense]KAA5610695.1 MFS transporter [Rhodovastum atsumiense]CAH2603303.1 hexuronate transporter [Rhodovastum atsumiense]
MPKIRHLRWWIIGLVCLGTITNYLARSTLGVAAPTLLKELDISTQQYSWILGAFQAGYTIAQPICGYVLDVIGLKIGFALFAVAWSVLTMAHGLAGSWVSMAWLRGLMGMAEATAIPAGMKTTAEWFPAKERGLAGGLFNAGTSVGAMLAPPLVVWAILNYNWQAAFLITGALGLVWTVLWLWFYQGPDKHPALTDEERTLITSGQETHLQTGAKPSLKQILRQRNFWGIALPRFLADPAWGTFTFWVPLYLASVRHWDLKQIAMFAWLPFLAADFGCIVGGPVASFLQRTTGMSLINARRCAFTMGAVLMLAPAFIGFADSAYTAMALICVGGFAHQMLSTTVITMASDLFRRSEVGTVAGLAGTCGWTGQLIFSLMIGALVSTIGYNPFFVCLGLLDLVGAVLLWTLVRERKEDAAAAAATPQAAH